MLEILFDILFICAFFYSFVTITFSLLDEEKNAKKAFYILDFVMLIFMSVYIIKSLNPFNQDEIAIFFLAVFFGALFLTKNFYSLVCIIKAKLKERREREERAFELLLRYTIEHQKAIDEEMRKKGLEAYVNARKAIWESRGNPPVVFQCEQRPSDWKPEKLVLYFDNSFSGLPRISIRHCSVAEPFFVGLSIDDMQMSKKTNLKPTISKCICGGQAALFKGVHCEGKDAYPYSFIKCPECGLQSEEFIGEEDEVVIEKWNVCMNKAKNMHKDKP